MDEQDRLLLSNSPRPSLQTLKDPSPSGSSTCETTDPSLSNLPKPPKEPLQSDCCGTVDPSFSNLPEPPEEPLQSDCYGTVDPSFSNLQEPPEKLLQRDCCGTVDPSLSNVPEPPEEPLQSDCCGTVDPSLSNLPEPPEEPLQSDCCGTVDPSLSNLPEPPEEPLQSDCCGTGCTPCVFDIYQEDLARWKQLVSLSPEEREAAMLRGTRGEKGGSPGIQIDAVLKPDKYRTFDVVAIEQVSSDSFVFKFGLPQDAVLGVSIGQHALLRVTDSDGRSVTRQYTPISKPDERGSFSVLIKVYEQGQMSRHIREWKLGSKADWRGPFGEFTYKPNQFRYIGMLACGTGIAPMVQVTRAIVENEDEDTVIRCLYACRTQQDVLMKPQLDYFRMYWNFTITYAFSGTSSESVAKNPGKVTYGDKIHYGRINAQLVEKEMESFLAEKRRIVLICGTKSFDKDMINILRKAGCTKKSCFKF